jgi:SAM-dependent methyltransferase
MTGSPSWQFQAVPVDRVRAYWDSRPCNLRHSPLPVGSRGYFEEVERRKYFVEPHIPAFADFSRWTGKRVLEIGCGIGTDTVNFARNGADITAVDLSEESLGILRRRAEVFDVSSRIRVVRSDVEKLSATLPVEPYDLIYSFGALHHTPLPDRALGELRKFAHEKTSLRLMVYHRWSTKVLGIVLRHGKGQLWKAARLVAEHSEAQTGCPVTYTFSRASAAEWLRRGGFELEQSRVHHIFPFQVAGYREFRYVKRWYWRALPPPLFRALERSVGWHLCLTARPGSASLVDAA